VRDFRETKGVGRIPPGAPEAPPQAQRTRRRRQGSQRHNDVTLEVGIVDPEGRVGSVHSTNGERRTHQRQEKHEAYVHETFSAVDAAYTLSFAVGTWS
jgi:hypothetical protein